MQPVGWSRAVKRRDGRPRFNQLSRNDVEEWLSCAPQEVIAWIAAKSRNDFHSRIRILNGIHAVPSTVHFIPTVGSYGCGWATCGSWKNLVKPTFRFHHQGVQQQLHVVLDIFSVFPFICHLGPIFTSLHWAQELCGEVPLNNNANKSIKITLDI